MTENLINLATKVLLEKFGAGAHKPGSGSAAAFQGLLGAQLLVTVIDLTMERTKKYQDKLAQLSAIKKDIQSRIYPELERLFQEDSDHFDKVIGLRRDRDEALRNQDWKTNRKKSLEADEALRKATDLPVCIALLCHELGLYASQVFDHGFQSARGDSGVALNCALAGLSGCLFIIELNLTKLPADDWMATIQLQKEELHGKEQTLRNLVADKKAALKEEADAYWQLQQSIVQFKQGNLAERIRNEQELEIMVREFQNQLWLHRDTIWKNGTITSPLQVIRPSEVLQKVLGYQYIEPESLGMYIGNGINEVAGIIDKELRLVKVSQQFPQNIRNFTAAHELGHLLLHKQTLLHRDRPFDGSRDVPKDPQEQQADKFAALFLMPELLVRDAFSQIFHTEKLTVNEAVAFALGARNIDSLRSKCKNRQGFAIEIAQASLYNGQPIVSLAEIFGVSVGTMAIRLIELDLVVF